MDAGALQQHEQTAADTAQQLSALLQRYESNPEGLKGEVVQLVSNNPQILQQFAPEFAKGILDAL